MANKRNKTFGSFLKKIRTDNGYSIKRLSPKLNVNYSYISKVENGHSSPSEDFIGRISDVLKVDKEELMVRAGKVPADVMEIMQNNPQEAIKYLRRQFGARLSE